MKAQRIYTPAPLANLQTLSFRIEDPEHHLLSEVPDAALIGTIAFSSDVTGSCYSDATGEYIFLQTKTWFSIWTFNQLDRMAIKGLTFTSGSQPAGGVALLDWLQGSAGQMTPHKDPGAAKPSRPAYLQTLYQLGSRAPCAVRP